MCAICRYAAKCMTKEDMSKEDMASLIEEMTILKSLDHPNIMKVEELFDEKTHIYLICHLYSGGELLDRYAMYCVTPTIQPQVTNDV